MRRRWSPTVIASLVGGLSFPLLLLVGCSDPPAAAAAPASVQGPAQAITQCSTQFSVGAATLPGDHRSIWGSGADVYVAGAAGEILRLDGAAQTVPVTSGLRVLFGNSATDLYAAGDGGVVLRSSGDGSWTRL